MSSLSRRTIRFGPGGQHRRAWLATAVLVVALLVVGGGVALWIDSREVDQLLEAGAVVINLDDELVEPVDNLAAGDRFAHEVTVRDHSSLALGGLSLNVGYDGDEALAGGLQVNVAVCEIDQGVAFDDCGPLFLVGGEAGELTFEDLGDIAGTPLSVDGVIDGYDGGDVAVRVVLQLDGRSDAQAVTGSLTYVFEAVQREPIDET